MALVLTLEQEAALIALADERIAKPAKDAATATAQAELDAAKAVWYASRDQVQIAANDAMAQVDRDYQADIQAKAEAVDTAKTTLAGAAVGVKV